MIRSLLDDFDNVRCCLSATSLAVVAISLVVIWAASARYANPESRARKQRQFGCHLPRQYPHKERLFGLDLLWKCTKALRNRKFLETVTQILEKHGPTIQYLILGNRAIITTDPENIRALLSTKFHHFDLGDTRKSGLGPLLRSGIFNVDGDEWKHSRSLLRPLLGRMKDANLRVFETNVQRFLWTLPVDASTVNLQELFDDLSMDIATEVLLGISTNCLTPGVAGAQGREFGAAFDFAQQRLSGIEDINIYSLLARPFGDRKLKAALALIDGWAEQRVKQASSTDHESASEPLLQTLLNENEDMDKVKVEFVNLLMAAKDTVKTLLSSVWFVIARRPDIWQRIQAEISCLNGQPPTREEMSKLKYVDWVIKETLRLYPPVAVNQRTATFDTTLPRGGGSDGQQPILVEKGTSVGFCTYALHRSERVFGTNSNSFVPERWESLEAGWSFIPFSGGPRTCLGKQLALFEVMYITVRLAQNLKHIENRDLRCWEEKISLNTSSNHGVLVSVCLSDDLMAERPAQQDLSAKTGGTYTSKRSTIAKGLNSLARRLGNGAEQRRCFPFLSNTV